MIGYTELYHMELPKFINSLKSVSSSRISQEFSATS